MQLDDWINVHAHFYPPENDAQREERWQTCARPAGALMRRRVGIRSRYWLMWIAGASRCSY
jgi:hypothetical protein